MVRNAIYYLDERIKEDYDWLIKNDADLKLNHLGYTQIQYLYARASSWICFQSMKYSNSIWILPGSGKKILAPKQ